MAKAKADKTKAQALDASPSHLLHRALQQALDLYADELGAGAITQRQYAVLAACSDHEGATQADLVRLTGIDRSTLADMAQRMIAKRLLSRERSARDARANAVTLTEAGRAALEEARPKVAAADMRLLKLISGNARRQAFVGLLRDIVGAADPEKPVKTPKVGKARKAKDKTKAKGKKKARKAPEPPAEAA